MSRPEKINMGQVCEEFAPVFKLSAEGLAHLGIPFETDRRAVLMPSAHLANLTDALIDFLYVKRDEFLGVKRPEPAAKPFMAIQWLDADDTEGGAI